MANNVRVLGQSNPSSGVTSTLYTCASAGFVMAGIWVCNQSTTPCTIRVGFCRGGVAAVDHNLVFDLPLDGNYFGCVTSAIAGKLGDNITIRASTGNVSFTAYGYD